MTTSKMYTDPKTTTYKIWHVPQIPGTAFVVGTDDLEYAKLLIEVLADYDLFQLEHRIKPDYDNVNGIMVWDEASGEYEDLDEDEG